MTAFSEHPFSPTSFPIGENVNPRATNLGQITSRENFYRLINLGTDSHCFPHNQSILQQLTDNIRCQFKQHFTDNFDLPAFNNLVTREATKNHLLTSEQNHTVATGEIVLMTAPVIATELVWLQTISQVATGQTQMAAQLIQIYLTIIQDAAFERRSVASYYYNILSASGMSLPKVYSSSFAHLAEIPDSSFDWAVTQLAFSQYPRSTFPEILGFTLAFLYRPALITVSYYDALSRAPAVIDNLLSQRRTLLVSQQQPIQMLINDYLSLFDRHGPIKSELWQRIQCGYFLYLWHFQRCREGINQRLQETTSLDERVIELFQRKAAAATGHHGTVTLGNKPLDDWFSEQPFAGEQFLKALRESTYINNDHPDASPLLKLFDFGGPMFGILNRPEHETLVAWVIGYSPAVGKSQETKIEVDTCRKTQSSPEKPSSTLIGLKNRKLYYYLVNAEFFPEVADAAEHQAKIIIKLSRWFSKPPIKQYDRTALDAFAKDLYQREMKGYQPLTGHPKLSKQAYLWGIEQFAPTILTDGCWLQHINQLTWAANDRLYQNLDTIYFDEIGCGVQQQNHPFIYHQLLEKLGFKIPEVHTQSFVDNPNFIDSAFDLPVYLMSIAMHPRQFLPELLGLNLAIELSGLGKVYMRLADEMTFWGIDPTIVKLHIAIDNTASGHSALALETIHCYLDDIGASLGEQQRQIHWHRVATGYHSLKLASRRFQIMLIIGYWQKKLNFR